MIGEAGYSAAPGSTPYMAPELFPSNESEVGVDELFSKESDVYAFVMVCFEVSHTINRLHHTHPSSDIYKWSTFDRLREMASGLASCLSFSKGKGCSTPIECKH
jgi:serine/threonine protein kinase